MMGLATIKVMNAEAEKRAQEERLLPVVISAKDREDLDAGDVSIFARFPYIGDYLPDGFERVRLEGDDCGVYMGDNSGYGAYFVDSSGFGSVGEPAMTIGEFADVVEVGKAYAIVETGQFQIKIGVFKRV